MEAPYNIELAVPFLLVANMDHSLKFYVDKLGFKIVRDWTPHGKIEWCWLQRDGVSLMLQEPRNTENLNRCEKGNGVSICFQCKDALKLYHEFLSKILR